LCRVSKAKNLLSGDGEESSNAENTKTKQAKHSALADVSLKRRHSEGAKRSEESPAWQAGRIFKIHKKQIFTNSLLSQI